MEEYLQVITPYLAWAYDWMVYHRVLILILFGFAAGYLAGYRPTVWRGQKMLSKKLMRAREESAKEIVADKITNALEDAELEGKLTRDEVNRYYKLFGTYCGLKDLLAIASKKHQAAVKAMIRERMKNGENKPVKIPGEPPPQNNRDQLGEFVQRVKRKAATA